MKKLQKREEVIALRVTEAEREIIKSNAQRHNMKVAPYIRMVAQNPNIISYDYSAIEEHTKQIGQKVNSVNQLIFTIHINKNYLPKEIEYILASVKELCESEKELLKNVRKQWNKKRKQHTAIQNDN